VSTFDTIDAIMSGRTESAGAESGTNEMEAALDQLRVGAFRFDKGGTLQSWNKTAERIFGLNPQDPASDRTVARLDTLLDSGLAHRWDDLVRNRGRFIRRGLECTNMYGQAMCVTMAGRVVQSDENADPEFIGYVFDVHDLSGDGTEQHIAAERLGVLADVSVALTSSLELNQILRIILTGATASQGLGFNRAFLFLYDQQSNSLQGHLAVGPSSAEEAGSIWANLESKRLSLGQLLEGNSGLLPQSPDPLTEHIRHLNLSLDDESRISQVCRSRQWANLQKESALDEITVGLLRKLGTSQTALVPMVSKGNLQGLIMADNLITLRVISDDDVRMLQILANNAAVAMERARLYDQQLERAQELEKANQLLKESQEQIIKIEKMSVIGELTSAVAHELRNPLTVIGGFANLMLKDSPSEIQQEYLSIIANETRRTEDVLTHLLEFHRDSQRGKVAFDFNELASRSLGLLAGRLSRPHLGIELSCHSEPLWVFGNPDQLSHAAYQLYHLVVEELLPPGKAEARTEQHGDLTALVIKLICPLEGRDALMRKLRQMFSEHRPSTRLTMLVAEETIRYHGGNFGCSFTEDGMPSLYIELPSRQKEVAGV